MDNKQLTELVKQARLRQDLLLERKGRDYTQHSVDRLRNFKHHAEDLGLTPYQVWAVYAGKHWDAILSFAKTGKAESEGIVGRLDDLGNYLYLLEALVMDSLDNQPATPPPCPPRVPLGPAARGALIHNTVWHGIEGPNDF